MQVMKLSIALLLLLLQVQGLEVGREYVARFLRERGGYMFSLFGFLQICYCPEFVGVVFLVS